MRRAEQSGKTAGGGLQGAGLNSSIARWKRGPVMRVIDATTPCPTSLHSTAFLFFQTPVPITSPPPHPRAAATPRPGLRGRKGAAAGRPPWPLPPPRPWTWYAKPLRTNPLLWFTCLCADQPQPLYRKGLASLGNGGPQPFRQVPPVPTTPAPIAVWALWWVRGPCCLHLPQW